MVAVAWLIASPAVRADLTTYGYGNTRLGNDPQKVGVSTANAHRLGLAWRTNVGGAVNGQPLVADGVRVGGRPRNIVFVATLSTGRLWR
jgi:hypothetical protein